MRRQLLKLSPLLADQAEDKDAKLKSPKKQKMQRKQNLKFLQVYIDKVTGKLKKYSRQQLLQRLVPKSGKEAKKKKKAKKTVKKSEALLLGGCGLGDWLNN